MTSRKSVDRISQSEVALLKRLRQWYSGDVFDCLDALGIDGYLRGLSLASVLPTDGKICGRASTIQFKPTRARKTSRLYHRAIDASGPGTVLVVSTAGASGSCTGELMCEGARVRGAEATIVDGSVRDVEQVIGMGYPLFARSIEPIGAVGRMEDTETGIDIDVCGIRIQPGDIIFGDRDGLIAIPKGVAEIVADLADALGKKEKAFRKSILAGDPLVQVFADV